MTTTRDEAIKQGYTNLTDTHGYIYYVTDINDNYLECDCCGTKAFNGAYFTNGDEVQPFHGALCQDCTQYVINDELPAD